MALWQILDKDGNPTGLPWDDGDRAKPGEDGFSPDKVKKHAKGAGFNYIGTPNWEPPAPEDGAQQ